MEGGPAINAALLKHLAEGQAVLLTKAWAETHAAAVQTTLDQASMLLLSNALFAAAKADDATLANLQAQAAGYWLAAVQAVATDRPLAERIEKALTGKPERAELVALATAVAAIRR